MMPVQERLDLIDVIKSEEKELNSIRDEKLAQKKQRHQEEHKSLRMEQLRFVEQRIKQKMYYRKAKGLPVKPPLTEAQKRLIANICNARASSKRRIKAMQFIWQYKLERSCQKCGESHPSALVFHHRDPKQKHKEVPALARQGKSIETIKKEIAKCDILCHNCHNILHWEIANKISSDGNTTNPHTSIVNSLQGDTLSDYPN